MEVRVSLEGEAGGGGVAARLPEVVDPRATSVPPFR